MIKPEQKEPTMSDVARLANVGTMTVSRVLSGSAPVNPATAARVCWAVETLNYRPNEAARTLRGSKSRSIGLIVTSLADPFFAICAQSINSVAQANGYSMILTTSNGDLAVEYSEAQWMLQRHIEGLIVAPAQSRNSKLQDRHFDRIPIVAFDAPVDVKRIDSVLVENRAGALRATQHLIEHNHKRIQFLGENNALYTIQTRFEGYRRALSIAGLPSLPRLDCSSQENVTISVRNVLRSGNPPTAFFCSNNRMTKFLMRSLVELRVPVPQKVAMIGFDDFELADVLQPALTVVSQPVEDIGKTAANVLFDRLKIKAKARPIEGIRKTLPVELILRSSCGCNPARKGLHNHR